MAFLHLPYTQGLVSTYVREVPYDGGNTTSSFTWAWCDAPYLEFSMKSEYANNWNVSVDGAFIAPTAYFPLVENNNQIYRTRIDMGTAKNRLWCVQAKGQSIQWKVPAGYTLTQYVHPGTRTYMTSNSWGRTGSAVSGVDPFGNTEAGNMGMACYNRIAMACGLNPTHDQAGGAGWLHLGAAGNNHLQRMTAILGGYGAGTFGCFICSGPDGNDRSEVLADVVDNMEDGYQLMRAHNATAPIIYFGPGVYQDSYTSDWDDLWDAAYTWVQTHSDDPNVHMIDLRGWLAASGGAALNIHSGGSHPNNYGHVNVAQYVVGTIKTILRAAGFTGV